MENVIKHSFKIYNGRSLAEQAAEQIINYIIESGLDTGEKLPNEFDLAESIGVGRGTVREAIKILVSRNIVEIRRGTGTFISEQMGMTEDPLGLAFIKDKASLAMDLLTVRLIIEPEIAAMAAQNATQAQIEALIKQCELVDEFILSGKNHLQEDIIFHRIIASCSKNAVVEKLIPVIHSSIVASIDVTSSALKQETMETHREILECITAKNPEGAKWAMQMHLLYNRMLISKIHKEVQTKTHLDKKEIFKEGNCS